MYQADIKDKGFRAATLGSQVTGHDDLGLVKVAPEAVEAAADQAVLLLSDTELRQETVNHNFAVGQRHYSLESLRGYLAPLMER